MKRFAFRLTVLAVTSAALVSAAFGLTAVSTAGASPTLPTLTLALNGKTVVVGGYTGDGAVNVATTVTGEKTGSAALVRLNPGVPFSAFAQGVAAVNAHQGDINYLDPYGSIVFDQPVSKGANVAETTLIPGNYFALDIGGNAKTPPHAAFVVTPSPYAIATLPKPGATIATIEFGFTGPSTLREGELVRFENAGFLVHMVVGIKVKNVATAKKVTQLLLAGKDPKASKLGVGFLDFVDGFSSGAITQETVKAAPGIYVLLCFMDTQDGREHTQLGMEKTIKIVK